MSVQYPRYIVDTDSIDAMRSFIEHIKGKPVEFDEMEGFLDILSEYKRFILVRNNSEDKMLQIIDKEAEPFWHPTIYGEKLG